MTLLLLSCVGTFGGSNWSFDCVAGAADAVVQSSIVGLASLFPAKCNQAIMNGNGVAAVVVSMLRIISKLLWGGGGLLSGGAICSLIWKQIPEQTVPYIL